MNGRPHSEPPDPQGILDAVVNQAALELPSMSYVKPRDPKNSYLMHKMVGDTCQFQTQCSSTPVSGCGEPMPQGGCTLDAVWRDTVRRWIAQGAQNN